MLTLALRTWPAPVSVRVEEFVAVMSYARDEELLLKFSSTIVADALRFGDLAATVSKTAMSAVPGTPPVPVPPVQFEPVFQSGGVPVAAAFFQVALAPSAECWVSAVVASSARARRETER